MDTRLKIVVVEDHEDAREELVVFLERQGWEAKGADCGEELNKLLNETDYHLTILDLNLPHEDGLSIAKRLRETHPEMGIIMLTARTRGADRLDGYQSGADVYLHKPVNLQEILAVINNMAQRLRIVSPIKIVLSLNTSMLRFPDGSSVKLTQTETQILKLISQMPSREANLDYLLEALTRKEGITMTQENLQVHVSRLRSKTNRDQIETNIVSSIRGFGYRLNLPLALES